MRLGLL